MRFSVCIPNFNYARYLKLAIESALAQDVDDLEVLVRDNCSTDGSVDVVRSIADRRVRVEVNRCNVGFAGNLDKVAGMATGDRVVILSSDDIMTPGALSTVAAVSEALNGSASSVVIGGRYRLIDAEGMTTGEIDPDPRLWQDADRDARLESALGYRVFRVPARTLLARCVAVMANPFFCSATFIPREHYLAVEGYGGGRLMNPDRWFHWRLLDSVDEAIFVDRPLADSRWHDANQMAQEAAVAALKFLVDEYVSTFQLPASTLERIGLTRADLERAFVEYDIGRHGITTLAEGHRRKAWRILTFGRAVYPRHVLRNRTVWALRLLLLLGPLGVMVARRALAVIRRRQVGRYRQPVMTGAS